MEDLSDLTALSPRKIAGSVIHDVQEVVARVVRMVKAGTVISLSGKEVPIDAQTICVHGDTPGAVEMVKAIRVALEREGVQLKAFGR